MIELDEQGGSRLELEIRVHAVARLADEMGELAPAPYFLAQDLAALGADRFLRFLNDLRDFGVGEHGFKDQDGFINLHVENILNSTGRLQGKYRA